MYQIKKRKIMPLRLLRTCFLLALLVLIGRSIFIAYTAVSLPAEPSPDDPDNPRTEAQRIYEAPLTALKKSNPRIKEQVDTILQQLDAYPYAYLDLLLRNPETAEFVAGYPMRSQSGGHTPLSVTEGQIPPLLQWDRRWGYESYGSSCIAISGCGPTSLSMVYIALTGDTDYTPDKMAIFSDQRGYYTAAGTSWKLMSDGARALGLNSSELPLDENRMKAALQEGQPLIASLGPGDFTTEGHFIVISGVATGGDFTVLDPNSPERSKKTWSAEKLLPQILNIWAFSKA